jgi:hypothetical protein
MKQILFVLATLISFNSASAGDTTKLNEYHNRVLKIYNQCMHLDLHVTEAIKTKNPQDIEAARSQLLDYYEVGIKSLDSIGNFEDDASLKFSMRDVLLFYKQLSETDLPQVRDYYVRELYFLSVKKEFDKKKIKKHTEQEILAFNSEAKKYNEALAHFTQLTSFMDNARKQTLYNWNASEQIFLRSHMAKL